MTILRRVLPNNRDKIRIHWFVRGEGGPVKTEMAEHFRPGIGTIQMGGAVGYIACQPQRTSILPEVIGNQIEVMEKTDDARAATCPECCATEEYKAAMANYATMLNER